MYKFAITDLLGKKKNIAVINYRENDIVADSLIPPEREPMHHIHILDRSGSMKPSINNLVDDVIETLKVIPETDYVTIIWFSTHKNVRTLVKFAKNDSSLVNLLNSMRSVEGCTCFSDPIKEMTTIVKELYDICPNICVTLFSDGEPVVDWGFEKEFDMSTSSIAEVRDKILAFNTIGYGSYYHEEFLRGLSLSSDFGVFIHTKNISDYTKIFEKNLERVSDLVRETVNIVSPGNEIIYLGTKNSSYASEGNFTRSNLEKKKNQFFIISDKEDFDIMVNEEIHHFKEFKPLNNPKTEANFFLAYAMNLYESGMRGKTLKILRDHTDYGVLIGKHMQAFTKEEVQKYTDSLKDALFNPKDRVKYQGKDEYNKPSLIDLLDKLSVLEAVYLPYHEKSGDYKRITRKSTDKSDLFIPDFTKASGSFEDIVLHKNRMNLSIRFTVPGIVKIDPETAKQVGLEEDFKAFVYRNHAFIKDGEVNISKFVVKLPESLLRNLTPFPYTIISSTGGEAIILFDSSDFSVVTMTTDKVTDASEIFNLVKEDIKLKTEQKVLKYIKNKMEENNSDLATLSISRDFTPDQINTLSQYGISKGVYNPPESSSTPVEDADFYTTRTCEFSIKGYSTIPKVEDVLYPKDKAKTTPSKSLMESVMNEKYTKTTITDIVDRADITDYKLLEKEIKELKYKISTVQSKLANIKIATILSGDMFTGFTMEDNGKYFYTKDGTTLNLRMERVKEYI